ncbi:MAG: tetratricopeptide repeat protein [Sandaracinaceae bacterium]
MPPARSLARSLPLAVLAIMASAASVLAQTADTPPEAIEFYAQARQHFESGEYEDAAAALEQAQNFDADSPTLAYNLARVYELMGRLDESLAQYRLYQELLPQQQAREQEQADSTIRRLQGALQNTATRQQEEAPPPPQEVAPLRQLPGIVLVRERGVADAPFWALLAGGVVAGATGAIFGALALDASGGVDDFVLGVDGGASQRANLQNDAEVFGAVTDVALGLTGVSLIAAAILYFAREQTVERAPVGARESEGAPTIDIRADDTQAVLSLGGVF